MTLRENHARLSLFACIGFLFLTTGCIVPHGAVATDVNARSWSEPAIISVANTDTLLRRDLSIFLRYDNRFAEDSLTVSIATVTPDSLLNIEYFQLNIDRTPRPSSLMRETVIPYRQRVVLAREGSYHFCITPTRTVRGIESVGIDLVKSE